MSRHARRSHTSFWIRTLHVTDLQGCSGAGVSVYLVRIAVVDEVELLLSTSHAHVEEPALLIHILSSVSKPGKGHQTLVAPCTHAAGVVERAGVRHYHHNRTAAAVERAGGRHHRRINHHHTPCGSGSGVINHHHTPCGSGSGVINHHHTPCGSGSGVVEGSKHLASGLAAQPAGCQRILSAH